ncbi:MAG: glycoside hydrolase family 66 protein [Fusobacterium sp.]
MINKLYFDKANYNNLDNIKLFLDSDNKRKVLIEIYKFDEKVSSFSIELSTGLNTINLGPFDSVIAGYRVFINCDEKLYTAVFSIDSKQEIIRYGFLSDFEKEDNDYDISWMKDNHINYVQFYDWSYHHDDMVAKTIEYNDSMGKANNLNVIKNKIISCQNNGMKAMAYGPIYAATKEYYNNHKEDAYYAIENKPLSFIDTFYFMNISKDCNWRNHIINEYNKSISKVGFDGIHLDTYGYPKRALDYNGDVKELDSEILSFLEQVSTDLDDAKLIFNNVGAWPLTKEIGDTQSAVYIEVWPPYESFYNLREIINKAKENYKPVIISAYIASFRLDRERALYSALFTTFYINSIGATHLFLGEEGCVITQGYYCDYSKLRDFEKDIIKRYQDFFVSYQDIIYDKRLKDVTMTHCGWDNQEYIVEGNYSLTAEKNHISVNIRANKNKHLISLINLENNDNFWNLGKEEPLLSSKLKFKVQVLKSVSKLYLLDPENNSYLPIALDYKQYKGDRSNVIEFEVPPFKLGSIVYIEEQN